MTYEVDSIFLLINFDCKVHRRILIAIHLTGISHSIGNSGNGSE